MSFGQRMRRARKACKLRQEDVARRLGVDFTTVSKWENDKANPDRETTVKLAELYGVDISYLLSGDASAAPATEVTEQEAHLLERIQRLDPEKKQRVLNYINGVSDRPPVSYSDGEQALLDDILNDLTLEDLLQKYAIQKGERPATADEIQEAIAYIKARRIMKAIE